MKSRKQGSPMKTKCKSIIRAACHSFGGMVCAGAVLLIASSAPAQNLFEADFGSGSIYEFTPGGAQSTFASGWDNPMPLAFNSAGHLFVGDPWMNMIYEYTPDGAQSYFATGLNGPYGLAFNSAGVLLRRIRAAATSMNSRRAERKAPLSLG